MKMMTEAVAQERIIDLHGAAFRDHLIRTVKAAESSGGGQGRSRSLVRRRRRTCPA